MWNEQIVRLSRFLFINQSIANERVRRQSFSMEFLEAVKLADSKSGLIGQKTYGATLDEIIIAPTSINELEAFKNLYVQTLNAQHSILPFMGCDVSVMGVYDKSRIRQIGAVILSDLSEFDD